MKDLIDVQDELRRVRMYVECAFMACTHTDEAEPIGTILDAASDKLKAIVEAIDAIKTAPRA